MYLIMSLAIFLPSIQGGIQSPRKVTIQGSRKKGNKSGVKVICLDEQRRKITNKLEADNCVFTKNFFKTRLNKKLELVSHIMAPNPQCKFDNICYAACSASKCLPMSLAKDLFVHKATWTMRFVSFASLFTGIVLGYLWLQRVNSKRRVDSLKYLKELEHSYESSEDVSKSEIQLESGETSSRVSSIGANPRMDPRCDRSDLSLQSPMFSPPFRTLSAM